MASYGWHWYYRVHLRGRGIRQALALNVVVTQPLRGMGSVGCTLHGGTRDMYCFLVTNFGHLTRLASPLKACNVNWGRFQSVALLRSPLNSAHNLVWVSSGKSGRETSETGVERNKHAGLVAIRLIGCPTAWRADSISSRIETRDECLCVRSLPDADCHLPDSWVLHPICQKERFINLLPVPFLPLRVLCWAEPGV